MCYDASAADGSCEGLGHIEYWSPSSFRTPEAGLSFTSKLDTDLYAHAKAKTVARSLAVSSDGAQFATFSADRCGHIYLTRLQSPETSC